MLELSLVNVPENFTEDSPAELKNWISLTKERWWCSVSMMLFDTLTGERQESLVIDEQSAVPLTHGDSCTSPFVYTVQLIHKPRNLHIRQWNGDFMYVASKQCKWKQSSNTVPWFCKCRHGAEISVKVSSVLFAQPRPDELYSPHITTHSVLTGRPSVMVQTNGQNDGTVWFCLAEKSKSPMLNPLSSNDSWQQKRTRRWGVYKQAVWQY